MKELRNSVCIVGVDESDELGTLPHKSQLTLHVEAVRNAVRDAGLKISDVDGIFTAGQHSPATIGEALGENLVEDAIVYPIRGLVVRQDVEIAGVRRYVAQHPCSREPPGVLGCEQVEAVPVV